jgi:hypothetical protein
MTIVEPEAGDRLGGDTLRRETDERWRELCERVVREQDPEKFEAAILELLEVLERDNQGRHDAGLGPTDPKAGQVKLSGGLGVHLRGYTSHAC